MRFFVCALCLFVVFALLGCNGVTAGREILGSKGGATTSTGGSASSGGTVASGGTSSGGTPSSGGSTASGGTTAQGGATSSGGTVSPPCSVEVTPATLGSAVTSSKAGDVLCLNTGNYGAWKGTNKAITLRASENQTPQLSFEFATGDSGFTLDGARGVFGQSWGMQISSGSIVTGASNITIRNCDFTGGVTIDGPTNAAIVFDHNYHHDMNGHQVSAAIHLSYGANLPSGVTIKNSLFKNLSADGVQTGLAVVITDNEFDNVIPTAAGGDSSLHTDAVQLYSGCSATTGSTIARNYFHTGEQAIGAFDGTCDSTIEDNVIQNFTAHWVTLGGDRPGSRIRHNTIVGSGARSIDCTSKTGYQPSLTFITDNIAGGINLNGNVDCTPSENKNNLLSGGGGGMNLTGTPQFVGGANPNTYGGFKLAPGSPGKNAASDGSDIGVRYP